MKPKQKPMIHKSILSNTVNKWHHIRWSTNAARCGMCCWKQCLMQINMFNTVEKEALCNHVNISSTTCWFAVGVDTQHIATFFEQQCWLLHHWFTGKFLKNMGNGHQKPFPQKQSTLFSNWSNLSLWQRNKWVSHVNTAFKHASVPGVPRQWIDKG